MYRLSRIALLAALLWPALLSATNNRSAVSVNGIDTNPCTVTSPCRSFAKAISQTSAGGEVVAIDSGGFGPFDISYDMTVEGAPGVYAGVTVSSGTAINVVTGAVTFRNLVINGLGSAGTAILTQVPDLNIENCTIENFTSFAVNAFNSVRVSDSTFRNLNAALWLDNPGMPVHATVVNVKISGCTAGIVAIRNGNATARNTVITDTNYPFESVDATSVLTMDSCTATGALTAVTSSPGIVRMSNCVITGNGVGVDAQFGTVESWGDNKIRGNTTNVSGSLTPVSQQ